MWHWKYPDKKSCHPASSSTAASTTTIGDFPSFSFHSPFAFLIFAWILDCTWGHTMRSSRCVAVLLGDGETKTDSSKMRLNEWNRMEIAVWAVAISAMVDPFVRLRCEVKLPAIVLYVYRYRYVPIPGTLMWWDVKTERTAWNLQKGQSVERTWNDHKFISVY